MLAEELSEALHAAWQTAHGRSAHEVEQVLAHKG